MGRKRAKKKTTLKMMENRRAEMEAREAEAAQAEDQVEEPAEAEQDQISEQTQAAEAEAEEPTEEAAVAETEEGVEGNDNVPVQETDESETNTGEDSPETNVNEASADDDSDEIDANTDEDETSTDDDSDEPGASTDEDEEKPDVIEDDEDEDEEETTTEGQEEENAADENEQETNAYDAADESAADDDDVDVDADDNDEEASGEPDGLESDAITTPKEKDTENAGSVKAKTIFCCLLAMAALIAILAGAIAWSTISSEQPTTTPTRTEVPVAFALEDQIPSVDESQITKRIDAWKDAYEQTGRDWDEHVSEAYGSESAMRSSIERDLLTDAVWDVQFQRYGIEYPTEEDIQAEYERYITAYGTDDESISIYEIVDMGYPSKELLIDHLARQLMEEQLVGIAYGGTMATEGQVEIFANNMSQTIDGTKFAFIEVFDSEDEAEAAAAMPVEELDVSTGEFEGLQPYGITVTKGIRETEVGESRVIEMDNGKWAAIHVVEEIMLPEGNVTIDDLSPYVIDAITRTQTQTVREMKAKYDIDAIVDQILYGASDDAGGEPGETE